LRTCASFSAISESSATCAVNVFDAATPTSSPQRVYGLRLARDLRSHEVRDRERPRAFLARQPHGVDRVARLARLRDADHERVLCEHWIPVDPLRRDVGLDR
jgi:hypothetical protein